VSVFRRMSTRRLIGVIAVVLVLATGGVAAARSLLGNGTPPPPSALDKAILAAASGPAPAGVTARITFTNDLIASGSLPGGLASPLLTGASGRLWFQQGGAFRLELQSDQGDTEIVGDGQRISLLDASSNTLYRFPAFGQGSQGTTTNDRGPLTLTEIDHALAALAGDVTVSGATPTTVAGQGAYETTLAPAHDGGLLGGLTVAFDAARGIPLRISVQATGSSTPVLQLAVTDISYGAVADSDVQLTPAPGTKVVDVAPQGTPDQGGTHSAPVVGLDAVRAAAGFPVTAPDTLDGLARAEVRLETLGDTPVALVTYGNGLGSIVVAESAASSKDPLGQLSQLPSISVNGATGRELATALGTAITFTHDGVRTLVAGSVPTVSAEQAARELTR
jgi:outer membrane lipoprotein-sorting protein